MAVEQVDCFNYAEAGNGPGGYPGGNLGTSRSFQKHLSLEHTGFLVNLQWSAARTRSCRMFLKPTFCKCAFSGCYLILQQLERHWNVCTECTAQASVAGAELGFRLSHVLIKLLFDDNVATLIPLSLH